MRRRHGWWGGKGWGLLWCRPEEPCRQSHISRDLLAVLDMALYGYLVSSSLFMSCGVLRMTALAWSEAAWSPRNVENWKYWDNRKKWR